MDELGATTINYAKPRLWIEKLWILDALTAQQPLREIILERGLNLVVSPQGNGSSGHGVGKTAFCQLLRFVLNDPQWSEGTTLKDELLQNEDLKKGAVAALVHIGDEQWTVLKPWQHQRQYKASRVASWQQLANSEADNEFELYQAAINKHFVDVLPIRQLPGSNQSIEWQHILAWCSRDQNARYQSYYQWRASGTGFSLPAKSPAALLQIMLGLITDGQAIQDFENSKKAVEAQKSRLQSLQEEPALLMKHVRRQLDRRLNTNNSIAFRQDGLFSIPNLIDMAKQRKQFYDDELKSFNAKKQALEIKQRDQFEQRAPLNFAIDIIKNEIAQLEAIVGGDIQQLELLQKEANSLQQRLPTRCDVGNRLLRECDYVLGRVEMIQLDRKQKAMKHQRTKETIEQDLIPLRRRLESLHYEITPFNLKLEDLANQISEIQQRQVQITASKDLLGEAIEDYEHYEKVIDGKTQTTEIHNAEIRLMELTNTLSRHEITLRKYRDQAISRKKVLCSIMEKIADSLPMFGWGTFNDEEKHINRPFQLGPSHSTTYGVLEILVGDIACLLDSRNEESFHPGFLIHDSPREAEMSDEMLWTLLTSIESNRDHLFQYIVTTSTEPAKAYKGKVRLKLDSCSKEGLLFRQLIGMEQITLN